MDEKIRESIKIIKFYKKGIIETKLRARQPEEKIEYQKLEDSLQTLITFAEECLGIKKILLEADSMLSYIRHRGAISHMGQLTYQEIDNLIGKLRHTYE